MASIVEAAVAGDLPLLCQRVDSASVDSAGVDSGREDILERLLQLHADDPEQWKLNDDSLCNVASAAAYGCSLPISKQVLEEAEQHKGVWYKITGPAGCGCLQRHARLARQSRLHLRQGL